MPAMRFAGLPQRGARSTRGLNGDERRKSRDERQGSAGMRHTGWSLRDRCRAPRRCCKLRVAALSARGVSVIRKPVAGVSVFQLFRVSEFASRAPARLALRAAFQAGCPAPSLAPVLSLSAFQLFPVSLFPSRGCMVAARPLQSAEALLQAAGYRSRAFARGCRLRGPTARLLGFETLVLWREALKVGDVTRKLRFCRSPFFPEAVVGICREEAFIKRHVEMVQNFAE